MLSPADRAIRITLRDGHDLASQFDFHFHGDVGDLGNFLERGHARLLNEFDCVLAQFVSGGHDLGIGLVGGLINDQVGELGCDVDRR